MYSIGDSVDGSGEGASRIDLDPDCSSRRAPAGVELLFVHPDLRVLSKHLVLRDLDSPSCISQKTEALSSEEGSLRKKSL